MAYGQTGSGKTITMGSEPHTELKLMSSTHTCLIPRFIKDLFNNLSVETADCHDAETSFLEVYGEDVPDLLEPSPSQKQSWLW